LTIKPEKIPTQAKAKSVYKQNGFFSHWVKANEGQYLFVRLEIATALKRNIRVIPVLVDDASMPRASDLPDDLRSLVRRNAVEVSHTRFNADSERLEVERRESEEKERLGEERRQKEERDRLETEQREERLKPDRGKGNARRRSQRRLRVQGMAKRDRSDKRGESEQGVDTVAKSQTTNLLTDLFQFF